VQSDETTAASCFREAVVIAVERLENSIAKKRKTVDSKLYTGLCKLKKQKTSDAASEVACCADITNRKEVELCYLLIRAIT
jgi:hypothetical protein